VDASAGVAGDMLVGALIDAGAPLGVLQAAVDAVVPDTVRLRVESVRRAGLRATKATVDLLAEDQPQRRWSDIRSLLERADLAPAVRAGALAVFARLAQAEARAHGIDVEDVHFHEVGAWDSIADVVGVAAGLVALGVDTLSAGPVALGSGSVRTAHGEMAVPVPAVLELAAGWRVVSGGDGERATPTGMAVLAALAQRCEDLPPLAVDAAGVGAGTKDAPGRANVVRVVVGTRRPPASRGATAASRPGSEAAASEALVPAGTEALYAVAPEAGDAVVLEANVDDLDPRLWPEVLAGLLRAGALDAWLVPILMKKGRPAHILGVLVADDQVADLEREIFALVPTLGIRATRVHRAALERLWRAVDVDGAQVRVKVGHAGGVVVTATPEFEDVAGVARDAGVPVRHVLERAGAAAVAAGLTPGSRLSP
jgi:uncharacterized protein (TIGR00299 family) protein